MSMGMELCQVEMCTPNDNQSVIEGMARICAEMHTNLKASKLRECEDISLFRHLTMLYEPNATLAIVKAQSEHL